MMDFSAVKSLVIPEGEVKSISSGGVLLWKSGSAIGDLPTGTVVYMMETEYTPYIVIAHGHHGAGMTTMLRKNVSVYCNFHNSAPSSAYYNRYSTSTLKSQMALLFNALPEATRKKIQTVGIPVRESANSSTVGESFSANFFALSTMELTGDGVQVEGSHISWFADASSRIATDGTSEKAYWTRSVVGGMNNFAKTIGTTGAEANASVTTNNYLRPACCVASDTELTERNGQYYME